MPNQQNMPNDKSVCNFIHAKKLPIIGDPTTELFSSTEFVGVEIELENISHIPPAKFGQNWSVVNDHSLKFKGKEIRFAQALNGISVINALTLLEKVITASPELPYFEGNRGSTHIHINITDLTISQLHDFVLLSYFMEPYLLDICPQHRRYNSFAVSGSSTRDQREVLNQIKESRVSFDPSLYKYRAIGLSSIFNKGSLEFRMFPSTYNKQEIVQWINLIQRIKYVASNTQNLLEAIVATMDTSVEHTVAELFGTSIQPTEEAIGLMWDFVRDLAYNPIEEIEYDHKFSTFYKQVMGIE